VSQQTFSRKSEKLTQATNLDELDDDMINFLKHEVDNALKYQVTPYRWLILFFYMNMIIIPSCICSSLTPAAVDISKAYGISIGRVNMCSIIFSIFYPPMSFLAIYMFKIMSVSSVLRLGALNLFLGGWFRLLAVSTD
jgi:hypothetical protein